MSEKCHSLLVDRRCRDLGDVASVSVDLPDRHVIPEHHHPEDQVIFASVGVMTVRTRESIWVVPPLRAVWIPAGTPHSVTMCGAVSMRTLYFFPGLIRTLPRRCFVMNVSPLLKELIVHACGFPKLSRKVPLQKSLVELTVAQLKTANAAPLHLPRPTDARAERIVRLLLSDPSDKRPLELLSKHCGASRRTIQRIFL